MEINIKKKIAMLIVIVCTLIIGTNSYAHSGRADANGGHKDKTSITAEGGSSFIGSAIALTALGGGGYLGYKKFKKK